MSKAFRWVSLLPIVFFALFLFGVREYGAAGGINDLALAVAAGFICFVMVGVMIYHRYDPPRVCPGPRERRDEHS